jgi:hypothetical protein
MSCTKNCEVCGTSTESMAGVFCCGCKKWLCVSCDVKHRPRPACTGEPTVRVPLRVVKGVCDLHTLLEECLDCHRDLPCDCIMSELRRIAEASNG